MAYDRKTIRNIDPDVLREARVFALQNDMNLGELVTQSLLFFIEEVDVESLHLDMEACD
jgi:hypothetical protein